MTPDPAALRALEHAVLYGDAREVAALLDADASLLNARFPDNLNLTPLMWACRNRRESVVADLIARGADVNAVNGLAANGDGTNSALWFTGQGAWPGTTGIAGRLIAAGADVDRRCEHGQTALWIAAAWAHLDLVQLLVARGADATVADDDGRTALVNVRDSLAWCDRRSTLTPDQRLFKERGPRVAAYLELLTA